MKKLFALTLAVAMVLSMASVAFAANEYSFMGILDEMLLKIDDHKVSFVSDKTRPLPVPGDKAMGPMPMPTNLEKAYYGDTLYIPVGAINVDLDKDLRIIKRNEPTLAEINKAFKLKADWSKNGSFIEDVRFEKVIVDGPMLPDTYKRAFGNKLIYVLAIDTKEMPEAVDTEDIIGTITIEPKSKALVMNNLRFILSEAKGIAPEEIIKMLPFGEDYKFDVAFTLNYKDADDHNVGYDATADDDYVYDFSKAGEDEEYELELFAGMGRFEVNTYGQGKLAINTNVEYNEGIENVAPDANYVYFNSNNPTFNRLGSLYLTADEDNHIYKVKENGSLEKITPKYDEDEEAFVIRTRVIGSYVIAEEELPENALTANVEKPAEAPVAPAVPANPSTGAAC